MENRWVVRSLLMGQSLFHISATPLVSWLRKKFLWLPLNWLLEEINFSCHLRLDLPEQRRGHYFRGIAKENRP